jgi:hypothetical protein
VRRQGQGPAVGARIYAAVAVVLAQRFTGVLDAVITIRGVATTRRPHQALAQPAPLRPLSAASGDPDSAIIRHDQLAARFTG